MGFFVCVFFILFSQIAHGRILNPGQNANIEQSPFSFSNSLGPRNNGQSNPFARNVATAGNVYNNIGTTDLKSKTGTVFMTNFNVDQSKNAKSSFTNFADARIAAQNMANNIMNNNIWKEKDEFGCKRQSNNIGNSIPPNFNQMLRPSISNIDPHIAKVATNIATPIIADMSRTYNVPVKHSFNPNIDSRNYWSNPTNMVNSNIANPNHGAVSLANVIMPGATFAIGSNPFTVLHSHGDQNVGFNVVAELLEIGGTVAVAGRMPFHATVSVNGNLPTQGIAAVNFGCNTESY